MTGCGGSSEELSAPDMLIWDFAKFDYPAQLHALWQALYKFESKVGTFRLNHTYHISHLHTPASTLSEAEMRRGCQIVGGVVGASLVG